jgi:amino acid adenylation domain-containing protein/thioester reductase-like protein
MTALSVVGRRTAYPTGLTVLDPFCQHVRDYPDKVAVRYADEKLSYRELNGKANCLAAILRAGSVRKGDIVPVIIGNSLELPISWLALIKLGAVFVPCDPAWPVERIQASLGQLRSRAVLTSSAHDAAFGADADIIRVSSKDLDPSDQRLDIEELFPEDLIYGFFTSGSTGQPKCALNSHRGIFNRFYYMTKHFSACEPKIVLLNSRHVFDSSVWQLLWPLTVPGEVVIPEQVGHLDIAKTIDVIQQRSITMTDFVPSIFNALTELIALDSSLVAKLSPLRWLLIGGEAINVKAVNKFRRLLPHVRLTNTYGPTEASIGMVFHDICEEDAAGIPLGSPIDNTFVAILDEDLCPVPPGQVGEIFIGGDCLGNGYLGDPEKTLAAFIPNLVPAIPGDRLYRTGDLGRQDVRGRIHFCGRLDTQTKVNGVRIEVAEIECALLRHEGVQEAVVIPIQWGALDRTKLCAFVVSRSDLSAAQLKSHLTAILPEYMLPGEFIFCPSLPLTPNGKVDRQSLAGSLTAKRQESAGSQALMSCLEEELLGRFRNVLGNNRIGIDDDFFEHGGDSLSALEVTLRVRVEVSLEIQDIYTWPTVRGLANNVTLPARELAKADVDYEAESKLADHIRVPPRSGVTPRRAVLVTGSTGFVGAHVLSALLQSTPLRIIALVRASDERRAFWRCRCALTRYGLWEDKFAERLSVVPADLSRHQLGLGSAAWEALGRSTGSIVHCGAMVDFLRSYPLHRPHNVTGTLEVIRLAASQTAKHLHYVSTLSIFDVRHHGKAQGLIKESDVPDVRDLLPGGYHQSKLVAESLVRKVRSDGLAVTIYRLGEVGPNSTTGMPNSKSFLNLLLTGFVRLGMYPASSFFFDCTPVDGVANTIAHCVNNGVAAGETFHVLQQRPMSFGSVINCLLAAGTRMQDVSYSELWDTLEESVRSCDGSPELTLLRALLPRPSGSECPATLLTEAQRFYGRDKFDQLLQRSTISFPELDESTLSRAATTARFSLNRQPANSN